ncbi:MAG: TRAP transporter substrate-binding protein DctP [Proteobacteria bacterium]|nr:TRAP transporter substrate-binding protein DctP [Pseudomonadota bacterium]
MRQLSPAIGKFAAVVGLATSLFGAAPAFAVEQWNYYTIQSAPLYSTSRASAALAEEIGKVTDGQVTVRRHLAGTLQISTQNMAAAVGENAVQMGEDQFFSGIVPVAAIMRLPFLVQTYDEFYKVNAIVAPYVAAAYETKGVTVVGMYVSPAQNLWSGKKEIKTLADIKGLKIRTSNPEQAEFIRKFGGSSISIGPSDVPAALDRGVVDGIITGSVGADLWKDLLKYGYIPNLNFSQTYIIANSESLKKLPADLQAKIRKAAAASGDWVTETQINDDKNIMANLAKVNISVTMASAGDVKTARDALVPYWEEWAKSRGPQFVEILGKIRAAIGK